jgi:hypothetical protein
MSHEQYIQTVANEEYEEWINSVEQQQEYADYLKEHQRDEMMIKQWENEDERTSQVNAGKD